MAKQYNQRHRAALTIIKPGDSVRILLPTQPHKPARVYSEPRLVDKVKGNTIWLRNGQRWNVRRCLLHCRMLKQPPSTSRSSPAMTHAEHAGRTIDNADENDDCATFVFPVAHGTSTLELRTGRAGPENSNFPDGPGRARAELQNLGPARFVSSRSCCVSRSMPRVAFPSV
jgi:hypothetical protein